MAASNHDSQQRTSVPLQKIEHAMSKVAALRQHYIESVQTGKLSQNVLQQWHSAIINYYVELRVYRNNDLINKKWDKCKLWQLNDDEWVRGMDTLRHWINRAESTSQRKSGRGTTTQESYQTSTLSEERLMRVSMLLDEFAHDLGIRVETARGRPRGKIEVEGVDDE